MNLQNNQQQNTGATEYGIEMTPEEMQADLAQLMSKVSDKYKNFKKIKAGVYSKSQDYKDEVLNNIFEKLAAAGVDGTNPQELNAFLEKLKLKNPEMYQMFSETINALIGEQDIQEEEPAIQEEPEQTMQNIA